MKVIGLTGSFGTGKSFVASVFKSLGAKVCDADRIAHEAIEKGSPAYEKVVASFGRAILDKRGSIDRKKLASGVFSDKRKLEILNGIVHPEVIRRIKEEIGNGRGDDVIVIDAPLLVEAKVVGLTDILIVVMASGENQVKRCMAKFGMKKEEVLKRISSQMPLEKKIKIADYVIANDGAKSETRQYVKKIWREIAWR